MWEAHCLLGFVGAVTVTHLVTSQRACAKVANQDAAPDDTVQQEVSPDKAVPHEAVVHETAQHLERRAGTVSPARTHNASAQTANRPSEQAAGLGLGRSCLFASVESACASPSTEHGGQAVGEGASVCQAADQVQPAPSGFGQRREQGQQEAVDIGKEVAGTHTHIHTSALDMSRMSPLYPYCTHTNTHTHNRTSSSSSLSGCTRTKSSGSKRREIRGRARTTIMSRPRPTRIFLVAPPFLPGTNSVAQSSSLWSEPECGPPVWPQAPAARGRGWQ